MQLRELSISGFQSFRESRAIRFSDGINLIVGQNNVGKSSILRALLPSLANDPHRSPSRWESFKLPLPIVRMAIGFTNTELHDGLLQSARSYIPMQINDNPQAFMANFLDKPNREITITIRPGGSATASYPGHGDFYPRAENHPVAVSVGSEGGRLTYSSENTNMDSSADLVFSLWQRSMFYFTAERMNIGSCSGQYAPQLSPNADNLPAVLQTLIGDRVDVFQKLVRHMREIFPTVGNVSVRPVSSGMVEIRIWPTESMQRVELSFPLLQSGTGVSQVMAILVAVMTVDNAVIVIDEINSFLHPAAVKSLLRILQTEYADHQYIISTHAPEVISFSNPRNIISVKRTGYESAVSILDIAKVEALREVSDHLGVSMSDVFAADRIIWVEGPTEELCFPFIYAQGVGRTVPRGMIFTSVITTGDFNAKRRDKGLVYEIYQRLSTAALPLVAAAIFSFDTERLTDAEKASMVRDSRGAMYFLPRRLIECYMINPDAIAEFVSGRDITQQVKITAAEVAAKLKEIAAKDRYKACGWANDLFDENWLEKVDAANLIADVCGELSGQRVTFNKKDDTLALLQIIQMVAPQQITGLIEYVEGLVQAVSERQAAA